MPRGFWLIRNVFVFFIAVTVYGSVSQVLLLSGSYSPIAFVLTSSTMPWYPPLSLVILSPDFGGNGWGVRFIDTGVGYKVPVMHYYSCVTDTLCFEYVPNSKSRFGYNPIETFFLMVEALIPPYPPAIFASERPVYGVLFVIPSWVYLPMLILAFRYVLYYRGRRVW